MTSGRSVSDSVGERSDDLSWSFKCLGPLDLARPEAGWANGLWSLKFGQSLDGRSTIPERLSSYLAREDPIPEKTLFQRARHCFRYARLTSLASP